MAMPLSLSANTSTSSGATGGYASNRGQLSQHNITNIVPDAAGNVLAALTGAQSMVSPFTGSGGYGQAASGASATATVSSGGLSTSASISPWIMVLGIGAIAFFFGRGGKL